MKWTRPVTGEPQPIMTEEMAEEWKRAMDPYNTAQKLPQWQRVLNYMQTHDHISSAIAWDVLRITSLHRRLTEIRKRGYEYEKEVCRPKGRPHYFKYRLVQ